ncbi:MAG: tRNA pseudouridine(55) synthase TruB [Alcanivoracaceae bacterium]|nr:tRNA pseudouridine(55) synthase TruB [Alcanivoracaceae bacterium]
MSKPRSTWQDVHGLILLNKPKGITSNLALQKVRRIFNAKKAGHTGSLDPMATGLLPCCFGDATKVAGLMLNADKVYIAECQIGCQTDTGDATGKVVKYSEKVCLNPAEIQRAIEQLTGSISQIPPMYSALHHNGKRLYELARAGIEVERKSREITIHSFKRLKLDNLTVENDINKNKGQIIKFEIKVSKGTYIRTLLEDFAKICGTYAHMTSLHRTQLGILNNDMIALEQLESCSNPQKLMLPMDVALVEYDKIRLNSDQVQTLIHGLQFKINLPEKTYRLYDEDNKFLGLGLVLVSGQLKVKKLFLKSYQDKT